MKLDVGSGGQVLDLDTAVKDGILGDNVSVGFIPKSDSEKLDLKTMIKELESTIEVPSVFICPISLETMQDPVTLCTGQTYERFNIVKWLSLGHYTCPTTMQELWDDTLTPNNTLHHLIYSWFSQKYLGFKKRSEDVHGRVTEVLDSLKNKKIKGQVRVQSLKELRQLVSMHNTAKKAVLENGGVVFLINLLGPFTSHALGSEIIGILVNLDLESASVENLMQPSRVSLMVDMLNEGSIETKINCTKLIEILMKGNDFNSKNVSSLSLLVGLLRLVKDKRYPNGVSAGLGLLKSLCLHESIRSSVVSIGAVPQLVELLPSLNHERLELALYILDVLSTVTEGKLALKDCANTIPNVVRLLMKVSENCTQFGLSILWAVCEVAPEECGPLAVEAGLAAKLLLVIQSDCTPALKRRSSELLKLCSLNYTATIFISKCKLTRTIQ
ncbi:U-box domain-containing protein 30-like [Mercurialis annua]|uniref:U-box domain-containing protein 30-like n=1 Tax=Mercurialis annua TaxID=3986 RepID=UPI00215FAD7E|nr:U-box domain-containing protein 30-like [Mercurialis annua]XP_050215038.1 U-box domain-containing protein 30-like [Mercurialis annua]